MLEVFVVFLRLGLSSFGGPIAHLGYFRRAFVERRRWLDDRTYVELIALCSFLPGPTSSQVGIAIGTLRAGYPGALAAWLGFTLPSAILMTLVAYGLPLARADTWVHGLLIAAVAVVADAIVRMARVLVPDLREFVIALGALLVAYVFATTLGQLGALAFGALLGITLLRRPQETIAPLSLALSWRSGALWLGAFALLLVALPFAERSGGTAALAASFFRAGALVFGGGHVVLPLLQTAFVPGAIDAGRFLAGYGAAQIIPGPLFTFAAYLGATVNQGPRGWLGAALATCSIFAPSFFLLFGIAPFWRDVRSNVFVAAAVRGLGAAVVGLLAAAFVHPIWTSAVRTWLDIVIVALTFALLRTDRVPVWGAVIFAAVLGGIATLRH